jgi:ATP-dependent Clp protease ATP-binding subunit ClpC
MFERFTERARRVIYFAQSEASRFGSTTIETEHLLLGLLREDRNITNRFLQHPFPVAEIRKEVERRTGIKEPLSTTEEGGRPSTGGTTSSGGIDSYQTFLPLSTECKCTLAFAAEETELLRHRHIGTEHLLLGLLRESNSGAAEILRHHGLDAGTVRKQLQQTAPGKKLV